MDSRRSIYSCRGAGRWRCRVGLDAAGKTAGEVVEFAERLILRIRKRPECVRKNAHPKEEPHHNNGAPLADEQIGNELAPS